MAHLSVKVGSKIVDFGDLWIIKHDTLWTSENEIFGALNTETSESDDGDLHLDELAHSFKSESTNLS